MNYINHRKSLILAGFLIAGILATAHMASASAISTLSGRDLSVGSRGTDVTDLQGLLSEQGYLQVPIGVPFGYFGSLTQSALSRYQASIGVPSTGYYGPMTRARISEVFTSKGWMALLTRENG
ncbi:MAG: trimeric autotransporter adhesin [Candidatus Parcubacteria bacterium]|jgi:N-acetylmuramoyl-L-alanine amidase